MFFYDFISLSNRWKDKLHSCEFVTEEVGQNVQPESAKATHLGYHADKKVQLFFYAAVTWLPALRTCAS